VRISSRCRSAAALDTGIKPPFGERANVPTDCSISAAPRLGFHLLMGRVYDDKDVQERIVRRSKLDWVIVRPVILTDGPRTNAYRVLADPRDWTCGFISRADVADFLVKQIDDEAFLHKTPVLTS